MKAPGRRALKLGTRLRRGAALQVMVYPRPGAKAALVEASRQLRISLSSLLITAGLGVAAKLAGSAIRDLISESELRQYMRARGPNRIPEELWKDFPVSKTSNASTQGGTMETRSDRILQIEDRAQKLSALVALLRDPQINDVVAELFGERTVIEAIPSLPRTGHKSPTLMVAIRQVANELGQPFTASDLVGRLKERRFAFRRPALEATRDALYRLSRGKNRIFRISEAGQGGKPNRYTLIS